MHQKNTMEEVTHDLNHLFKLPNEIILLIAEYLPISSLNSFIQTAKRMEQLLTYSLYTLALTYKTKYGESVLEWASMKGRTATIERILNQRLPDNYMRDYDYGWDALCLASKVGHEDAVRLLLAAGANTYPPETNPVSPLMIASARGHDHIVKLLLNSGEDVNMGDRWCRTPLLCAAYEGHITVVRLLLEHGAELFFSYYDIEITTPLHAAVRSGDLDVIRLFLDFRPDAKVIRCPYTEGDITCQPLFRNNTLSELLHVAMSVGMRKNAIQAAQLLLERGANVNEVNVNTVWGRDRGTPLHFAVKVARRNTEMVQFLIEHGADVCAVNYYGDTPLHMAADQGNTEVIRLLLNRGADVRAANRLGQTAMDMAVSSRKADALQVLLDWMQSTTGGDQ